MTETVIEKLLIKLPIPALIAVVILVIIFLIIKDKSNIATIRNRSFKISVIIVLGCLLLFYLASFIISINTKFDRIENGIIIAKFVNDKEEILQPHIAQITASTIRKDKKITDFKIMQVQESFNNHDEARKYCKSKNSKACIWGVMVPPDKVWLNLSMIENESEIRLPLVNYMETNVIENILLSNLKAIPPSSNNFEVTINFLKERNEQLTCLIHKLVEKPNFEEKRLPKMWKFSNQGKLIKNGI